MTPLGELTSDPVFQLNSLLWLTQLMPKNAGVRPVLREVGFEVYAIGPLLAPPPDLLLAIKDSGIDHQERVRPDVVLHRKRDARFGPTECKGNSFGPNSTTAKQARTLLLLSGPRLSEALGVRSEDVRETVAAYLLPATNAGLMHKTLSSLRNELTGRNLPAAPPAILGLQVDQGGVSLSPDNTARDFFGLPPGTVSFLQLEDATDPRPLYFIPYDPDCDQSPDEKVFCKRILFERLHSAVLGGAGRAVPAADIVFETTALLNDATLGMYDLWENTESTKHMRRLVRQLLGRLSEVVCAEHPDGLTYQGGVGWRLHLADEATQMTVCTLLSKFSCETMDLRHDPEPELFDDL
jgi:hypothetical protein